MARKVKIVSVQGKTAITADGERLRVIGNIVPNSYGYTDGVVLYGYSLPCYTPEKRAIKQKAWPVLVADDTVDDADLYLMDKDVQLDDFLIAGVPSWVYPFYDRHAPLWAWTREHCYMRADDNSDKVMYDENGDEFVRVENEFLMDISNDGYSAQAGDFTALAGVPADIEYRLQYGTIATQATRAIYPGFTELDGTLNNLSFVSNTLTPDGVLQNAIQDIIDDCVDDVEDSEAGRPSPVACFHALYNNPDYICGALFYDYGDKRFIRLSDNKLAVFLDLSILSYPYCDDATVLYGATPGWWPQLCLYRTGYTIEFNGNTYSYQRFYRKREARWLNGNYPTAWDRYYPAWNDETANTGYTKEFDNGYTWKSSDGLVYRDGEPVSQEVYTDVIDVYKGRILGKKNDGFWYNKDSKIILPDSTEAPLVDMFRLYPVKDLKIFEKTYDKLLQIL